jgi:hypothetical protein
MLRDPSLNAPFRDFYRYHVNVCLDRVLAWSAANWLAMTAIGAVVLSLFVAVIAGAHGALFKSEHFRRYVSCTKRVGESDNRTKSLQGV